MTSSMRVLIVDDHDAIRKGIQALLSTEPSIEVCGEAEDGERAIVEADRLRPDVILLDLVMPGMSGAEIVEHITANQPDARILVLTTYAADDVVYGAIRAGAHGYLMKDAGPDELIRVIRETYDGTFSLQPAIARKLLQELSDPPAPVAATRSQSTRQGEALTAQEVEILQLVARRYTTSEIGEYLAINDASVSAHTNTILRKLHAASRSGTQLRTPPEAIP